MLMAARLTASLLTSSEGGVRLCVAVPNVDLLPYFGGSQRSPKEQLGGGCGQQRLRQWKEGALAKPTGTC